MFDDDNQNQPTQANDQTTPVAEPVPDGSLGVTDHDNSASDQPVTSPSDNTQADDTQASSSDSSAPLLSNDAGSYIATDPAAADNTLIHPDNGGSDDSNAQQDDAQDDTKPAGDQNQSGENSEEEPTELPAPDVSSDDGSSAQADGNDLLNIKQQALQQLTPLVGHLDQTPEEKFRTTMMMIQASDNQSLISTAYEAAQGISDEKERAQALLDVVNEINYFTQQNKE